MCSHVIHVDLKTEVQSSFLTIETTVEKTVGQIEQFKCSEKFQKSKEGKLFLLLMMLYDRKLQKSFETQ